MKPRTVQTSPNPDYPDAQGHLDRRGFLGKLGPAAACIGLGLAAAPVIAGETTENEDPEAALKATIAKLAKQLGNDEFRVRREAATKLIAIGKGNGKDKKADAKSKELVLTEMADVQKTSKDPEARQRAKAIVLALMPRAEKPEHGLPRPVGRMRGLPNR